MNFRCLKSDYFPTDRTALVWDLFQLPEDQAGLATEEDILLSAEESFDGTSPKQAFPKLPPRLSNERTLLSKTIKGGTVVSNAVEPSDFACK